MWLNGFAFPWEHGDEQIITICCWEHLTFVLQWEDVALHAYGHPLSNQQFSSSFNYLFLSLFCILLSYILSVFFNLLKKFSLWNTSDDAKIFCKGISCIWIVQGDQRAGIPSWLFIFKTQGWFSKKIMSPSKATLPYLVFMTYNIAITWIH